MPDILYLIANWWKQMLALVLVSLLTAGVIVFLQPSKYLSVATAVPASSISTDKARVFNENIQSLYSDLGSPDDLDILVGTGQLDTIYLAVTDQFNLYDHYKVKEKGQAARTKAARLLKYNSKVIKSDYGELKIKVWDTDKQLAPQLANALMEKLKTMHRDLQSANNQIALKGLQAAEKKIKMQIDSINGIHDATIKATEEFSARQKTLSERLQQYEKLIGEYQLMVDSKPPVLIPVEFARPAAYPDKPRRLEVIVAAGILSLFFALLVALVLERRKSSRP
ncbi:MAG TPA: hypothetical protein VET23_09945 [Chitinophagaceae bacterium]|nr:hypothetical protein [Chitinophagaceae bacterium]